MKSKCCGAEVEEKLKHYCSDDIAIIHNIRRYCVQCKQPCDVRSKCCGAKVIEGGRPDFIPENEELIYTSYPKCSKCDFPCEAVEENAQD